jgi:cell division protein FtsN
MPKKSNDGLRKDGTSHRSRSGGSGRGNGTPPVMIAALVVVVIGAALLFWPKGGSSPTGIGEQQSVVTMPDSSSSAHNMAATGAARSGDVDINQQGQQLTPEIPEGEPQEKVEEKAPTEKPKPKPVSKPKSPAKPAVPPIQPQSEGRWAVQTGGFGDAVNADKEAARLQTKGWQSMVRAGSNSQGNMVYRVWIGYFASRDEAGTFIKQNRKNLADAFVVHR